MKILEIDRRTWLRGEGGDCSMLLRPKDKKMCCLGFLCLHQGVTEDVIEAISSPADLIGQENRDKVSFLINDDNFIVDNVNLVNLAIDINDDDENLDNEIRERMLRRVFKEWGIDLVFIN